MIINFLPSRVRNQCEKIRSIKREILWLTIFLVGSALAFYQTFHYYYFTRERAWRVVGGQLIIARVMAAVLRYCFALILFCVAHRSTRM